MYREVLGSIHGWGLPTALATNLSADADWKHCGLSIGPQFNHLDVNVQEEFNEFLGRERY